MATKRHRIVIYLDRLQMIKSYKVFTYGIRFSMQTLKSSPTSCLHWGSDIVFIAKTASNKIWALIQSIKFLSPVVVLYLYKSTIQPCIKYCCYVWAVAPIYYFDMLDKLEKRVSGLFRRGVRSHAHTPTRAKVFRRAINRTRK